MTSPIQLSLAGNARLLVLTPETVRKAYFQFTRFNQYNGSQKHYLDIFLHQHDVRLHPSYRLTILDVLHRFPKIHLHPIDINWIEQQLNWQIIKYNSALVDGEGELLTGYGICRKIGRNREKVRYIIRHGMIFILETTTKSKIISTKNTDIIWQDRNYDFHYDRYCGLRSSLQYQRVELLFRNRLDLTKSWTRSLAEFQPRQIFTIAAIYPTDGFAIAGADGKPFDN
jgi:hypothetical protein